MVGGGCQREMTLVFKPNPNLQITWFLQYVVFFYLTYGGNVGLYLISPLFLKQKVQTF